MHYDEQFEREILEASINIRNEHKDNNIEQVFTEEDLSNYLTKVEEVTTNELKTDYILGDITEEQLLEGINPAKAHADLVEGYPTSEVASLINDPWHPLFEGDDGDFSDIIDNIRNPSLKDTKGKAHGARYCYLADIAKVAIDHGDITTAAYNEILLLGQHLSIIVASVDDNNINNAQYYCSEVLNDLIDERTLPQLVGVRAHALSSGKYSVDGYREPIDVNLLLDAAARHFLKMLFVNGIDEESGFLHEAHIAANVIMLHTQLELLK